MSRRARRGQAFVLTLAIALASAVCALAVLPAPAASAAPAAVPTRTYVTDGRVDAVLPLGSRVYLAGAFTLVGPDTGLAAVVDPTSATLTASWGLAGGSVLAQTSDGAGGWYIGGLFTVAGGVRQANAAHVLADGTLDQTWNPRPNNAVRAIAYDPGSHSVYLGGDFTNVHSSADAYVAAVDDSTGAARAGFALTTDGSVRALALDPGRGAVYVGGSFLHANGLAQRDLAAASMSTGALGSPLPALAQPNGNVLALALSADGSVLYAGGTFTTVGGSALARLAAVSTSTGAPVAAFHPGPDGAVDALLLTPDGTGLYAGGEFAGIAGAHSPLLARLALSTGAVDPTFLPAFAGSCTVPNPDTPCTPAVRSLALGAAGDTVLAGGWFTSVHGLSRANAVELATADAPGTPTAWNPVANGPVDAIGSGAGGVLLGGELTSVNATPRSNLAALDRTTGALDPTWGATADGQVRALVASADGTHLWAGGDFGTVDGVVRVRLAKLDTLTGGLDPTFHPIANKSVSALALVGSKLYAGGSFSTLAAVPARYLGQVDANTGAGNPAFLPVPNGVVLALGTTPSGGTLWTGGRFSTIGGRTLTGLAAISSTTGRAWSWTPQRGPAGAMALSAVGSSVCVGTMYNQLGCFDTATGKYRLNIRHDGNVQAVAISGTTVYAGGHFNTTQWGSADVVRRKLESYSLTTGLLQPWAPVVNSALGVFAIAPSAAGLAIGGDFTEVGGASAQGFALLTGAP